MGKKYNMMKINCSFKERGKGKDEAMKRHKLGATLFAEMSPVSTHSSITWNNDTYFSAAVRTK